MHIAAGGKHLYNLWNIRNSYTFVLICWILWNSIYVIYSTKNEINMSTSENPFKCECSVFFVVFLWLFYQFKIHCNIFDTQIVKQHMYRSKTIIICIYLLFLWNEKKNLFRSIYIYKISGNEFNCKKVIMMYAKYSDNYRNGLIDSLCCVAENWCWIIPTKF